MPRSVDALTLLEQAVRQIIPVGGLGSQTLYLIALGEAYVRTDRTDEAYDRAQHALALAREHHERGHEAHALRLHGNIAMHRHPPDIEQAETHYQQALALAQELGMRPLQAHCHRGLGNLYIQTGQSEQARAELSTAIEMYRDMEMMFWLPQVEAALARMV